MDLKEKKKVSVLARSPRFTPCIMIIYAHTPYIFHAHRLECKPHTTDRVELKTTEMGLG